MTTLRFNPTTYTQDACLDVRPGDTMELESGVYPNKGLGVRVDGVTIRGIPGPNGERPHFQVIQDPNSQFLAQPFHIDGRNWNNGWNDRGPCVIKGKNCTVENMEFSGAKSYAFNGAGIRHEGEGLIVRNSYFHNNENGILGGDIDDPATPARGGGDIVLENNEFGFNGTASGGQGPHNVYIGLTESLTFRGNYSHDAIVGHTLKSRARKNRILGNVFVTGLVHPAYAIDIDGGDCEIANNIIEKLATADKTANKTCAVYYYLWHENGPNRLSIHDNWMKCLIADMHNGAFVKVNLAYDKRARADRIGTVGQADIDIQNNICVYADVDPATPAFGYTYGRTPFAVPVGAIIGANTVVPVRLEPPRPVLVTTPPQTPAPVPPPAPTPEEIDMGLYQDRALAAEAEVARLTTANAALVQSAADANSKAAQALSDAQAQASRADASDDKREAFKAALADL